MLKIKDALEILLKTGDIGKLSGIALEMYMRTHQLGAKNTYGRFQAVGSQRAGGGAWQE
jgi:hypothetical protein